MKQLRRVVLPLVVVALLVCHVSAFSQQPEPRLKGTIGETSRVVLLNSRTPRVRAAQGLSEVSAETSVTGITLVFRRPAAQEAALKELLAAQQSTASPLYHQWLTPEACAARFGVADEDIATTASWLAARGFHVESVARCRSGLRRTSTGRGGEWVWRAVDALG